MVEATKARVNRLETVVSNISLAKLIERIMQVEFFYLFIWIPNTCALFPCNMTLFFAQPLPDPSSVSSEVFRRLEREQAALKIQVIPPFAIFVFADVKPALGALCSCTAQRSYYRRNARLGWNSLMVTSAPSLLSFHIHCLFFLHLFDIRLLSLQPREIFRVLFLHSLESSSHTPFKPPFILCSLN